MPIVRIIPSFSFAIMRLTLLYSLFNFFFSVGWLAIPWLYPAEIAPLRIRAKAAALSTVRR